MPDRGGPDWVFFLIAVSWVALWIAASIIYRRLVDKPLVPRLPEGALFAERSASGRFASNCLLVAVTNKSLSVSPKFPLNLMFLPEVYRLERDIPVSEILEVKTSGSWFGYNFIVTYGHERPHKLRLRVRNPKAAAEAVERAKQASAF